MSVTPDDPESLLALAPAEQVPSPAVVPDELTHVGVDLRSKVGAKLALAMFLHHFSLSAWFVTLSSYIYANSGHLGLGIFTAGFVGKAYSAGPLGGIISPFLTGLLADHFFATERLMAILNVGAALAMFAAIAADSQTAFYFASLAYFVCFIPSFSLTTSMTLHHLKRPERDFPVVRACSTTGWIVAGVFVGWLWPLFNGGISIEATATPMKIAAVAQLVTAAFCLFLPHTPPTNRRTPGQPSGFALSETFALMRHPRFLILLGIAIVAQIPTQFYYTYLNVYLNTWIDMKNTAAKMALGQVVEVICMLLLPALLLRISVKASILIGLAVWTVRFWVLSVTAASGTAGRVELIYMAILVHGVAFTLVSIALQLDVDGAAGHRRRATAQGLLAVAMSGIGSFLGADLAGMAGARWLPLELEEATEAGWQSFWLAPTYLMAGVFVLTALLLPRTRRGAE